MKANAVFTGATQVKKEAVHKFPNDRDGSLLWVYHLARIKKGKFFKKISEFLY